MQLKTRETQLLFDIIGKDNLRFVGGCVRNSLLQKENTDIDLATVKKPQEVMNLLKNANIRVVETGIKYGTVTAVIDGQAFEITTLRRDLKCDGRYAEVEFTDDWEEDASRRDFTINAMSCDLDGKLYDYFSGKEDLAAGLVRFVGDANKRVEEDVLRILRFFRFNAYFAHDFDSLDKASLDACVMLAKNLPKLSGERISNEMFKLLDAPHADEVLKIMYKLGITGYLFGMDVNINALNNLDLDNLRLDYLSKPLLRLAALLSGNISDAAFTRFVALWRLSRKDSIFLHNVLFPVFPYSESMDISGQRKYMRIAGKDVFVAVMLINSKNYLETHNKIYEALNWDIPKFPVSGKDLIILGIGEGKKIGEMLAFAEKWWEEGGYKAGKEDILQYIQGEF
jgi:poly(A) polymerase